MPMNVAGIIHTGEFKIDGSIQQLPNVPCNMVLIKAWNGNGNAFYIGGPTVTVTDSETDETTGLEMMKSEVTPWLFVTNLNTLYVIGTSANGFTYICIG